MRLEIAKEGVFIPAFNGNRELPAADQISVRYRTPTVAIKSRCRKKPQAKGIAAADGSLDRMEITIEKDSIATLNEMLISIANCSYGGGGEKDRAIASAQDLVNAPIAFEPLLKEIVAEFDSVRSEERRVGKEC
jgi:hypothetical protein